MPIGDFLGSGIAIFVVILVILTLYLGIKIVPQSEVYVVERFGKFTKTLTAGLSLIVPYLDKVAHRISILERQLPEFSISVITRDNVEVRLETTVFYRVVDAGRTVYRFAMLTVPFIRRRLRLCVLPLASLNWMNCSQAARQ